MNATFHLLRGKKSIQTIQDARLFQLERFFGIYPKLTEVQFAQFIERLAQHHLLTKRNNELYVLTETGEHFLIEQNVEKIYIDSTRFSTIDELFFKRLILGIQLFTHVKQNNVQFIPIIEDRIVTSWMKSYYNKHKRQIPNIILQLYDELERLLSFLPNPYPAIVIDQISSAHFIGLTHEQISRKYHLPVIEVYLITVNVIHYMLQTISRHEKEYPILHQFTERLSKEEKMERLTKSAQITYRFILDGYTLEEIAMKRELKVSTIYDHVVEIALHDETFPIEMYISQAQLNEISHAIEKIKTRKLKEIKQEVSPDISFFQIRLALTKIK